MFAEGEGPQGAGPCWDGTAQHVSWGALAADAARSVAADETGAVADTARSVAADETTSAANKAAAVGADATGAGASFGVGVLAAVARPVGQVLLDGVSDASRVLARSAVTALSAPRCAEGELLDGLGALDTLATRVARVMVTVLVEAYRRGLHLDTGLSVHDWVAGRCPGLTKAQVGDLATVVKAWDSPGHGSIRDAVTGGDVSVARAARLVRALTRVVPVTDPATYAQVVDLLVPVAAQGSDKDLATVTDHLVAVALADKETEAKTQACHDSRGIHESSLAGGALTRFILTADAQGAATIRAILGSPLAGPAPDATGPDPRTPTQRRYDAIMTVLDRGMSSPQGTPSTAKAKIFLTIPFTALALSLAGTLPGKATTSCACRCRCDTSAFGPATDHHMSLSDANAASSAGVEHDASSAGVEHDETNPGGSLFQGLPQGSLHGRAGALSGAVADGLLQGGSGGSSGALAGAVADLAAATASAAPVWPAPGLGRTFTGEGLTPGQVRRLAYQADLIPVVLGTGSEVLDLGRESRLASPAQLKKLWLRDQQCTFPGCTVPPTWCDAHHLLWWIRGGRTDIANLALLCPRHHTIVHDKDLIATVDTTGVTWHL